MTVDLDASVAAGLHEWLDDYNQTQVALSDWKVDEQDYLEAMSTLAQRAHIMLAVLATVGASDGD